MKIISSINRFMVVSTLAFAIFFATSSYAKSHEGRTDIAESIAARAGITTAAAGPGQINQTLTVYGKAVADPSSISHVRARFPGTIIRVAATIGDEVAKGDVLAEVESNESLKRYSIRAPFTGVITARHGTAGEQTEEQPMFTVANFDRVWAEFQVFPGQVRRVRVGQAVAVSVESIETMSVLKHLIPSDSGLPFVLARAPMDNTDGLWTPGLLLVGKVSVDQFEAALVVDNRALHSSGDEKVVFIKAGETYEARPLKLGRGDGHFTEVLEGLSVGDQYVVDNSYLIKADLEKSGASHDH
jgi:cobalt-zinc-cadmium efflux system membrane fusion protein